MRFRMPLMLRQGIAGCAAMKSKCWSMILPADKAHDNRLLGSLVGKEVVLGHALDKAARISAAVRI
jgi:hypothetical protein